MTKLRATIIGLVAVQIGLSALAATLACNACQSVNLGWLGAAFYAALLAAVAFGWERLAAGGVTLAFATHAVLMPRLISGGPVCGLCLTMAIIALAILVLRVVESRRQLAALAWGLVPSCLAAALMAGVILRPANADAIARTASADVPEDGIVSVLVFESADCPYCERFRKDVAPLVAGIYGDRVRIRYVDAAAFADVRVTPTIVLRSRSESAVIEGLPNPQLLIRAIGQLLSSPSMAGGAK